MPPALYVRYVPGDPARPVWSVPDKFAPPPDWAGLSGDRWLFIVDARADFKSVPDFAKELCETGLAPDARAAIVMHSRVLMSYGPGLAPHPEPDSFHGPADSSASDRTDSFEVLIDKYRENEFYLRMFASYGWGQLVRAGSVGALVDRYLRTDFPLDAGGIDAWRGDLDRFCNLLRVGDRPGDPNAIQQQRAELLDVLGRLYSLGHRDEVEADKHVKGTPLATYTSNMPWLEFGGSYAMKRELGSIEHQISQRLEGNDVEGLKKWSEERVRVQKSIAMFNIHRDAARCLALGAAPWAAASSGPDGPLQVLLIGSSVSEPEGARAHAPRPRAATSGASEPEAARERITKLFEAAFRPGQVELAFLQDGSPPGPVGPPGGKPPPCWADPEWWTKQLPGDPHTRPAGVVTDRGSHRPIVEFDAVVLDVEYKTRFVGASIVHWVTTVLDDRDYEDRGAPGAPRAPRRRPAVFVLSRLEHLGRVVQCVTLGAEAYVPKDRVLQLPAQMTAARVGARALPLEPRHSKPNFRTLYDLPQRALNGLKGDRPEELVRGDDLDQAWLERLPKADLHFHIGTSISLGTVAALACNTAGYYLASLGADAGSTAVDPEGLVERACKTVVLANCLAARPDLRLRGGEPLTPPLALWVAARFILRPVDPGTGGLVAPDAPEGGVLDQVVDWLTPAHRPVRRFEACAVLVAAVEVFRLLVCGSDPGAEGLSGAPDGELFEPLSRPWAYLNDLSEAWPNGVAGGLGDQLQTMLDYHARRVGHNWNSNLTKSQRLAVRGPVAVVARGIYGEGPGPAAGAGRGVLGNVARAAAALRACFGALMGRAWVGEFTRHTLGQSVWSSAVKGAPGDPPAAQQLAGQFDLWAPRRKPFLALNLTSREKALGLCDLVVIPPDGVQDPPPGTATPGRERTLHRYLWGAGLLGADHLQYAENILLAGADLVRQAVADNVVYSEVRCSTTGYCEGGLTPYDATDLLCLSFDLAAAYFGTGGRKDFADRSRTLRRRWVRTNVILGAKRHKLAREFADIVGLLESYLRRSRDVPVTPGPGYQATPGGVPAPAAVEAPGGWWDRASVVGFDMSGDESARLDGVEALMQPLFRLCSPVTIHAGEAQTAQSIWDAVYRLGAQRIGHGLRLRERDDLLRHCVARGICMELCPVSNAFTSIFSSPAHTSRPDFSSRAVYPLPFFLDAGLDVCINTDNRSLHPPGHTTLTAEYRQAARMAGGLTRWELLKIVKAGFKHAFLPKPAVTALLRHVEFEVHQLTGDDPSGLPFPPPGTGTDDA